MKFPPEVELGREASRKISENIHQNIQDSNKQAVDIEHRINSLNKDFDDLQILAEELSMKYEKAALKPGGGMDKKILLQPILDHNLESEDIQLCRRYINRIFSIILDFIHKQDKTFQNINNLVVLHRQRRNSSDLSNAYDTISKKLGLDNSGKVGSCIFELFEFLRDFQCSANDSKSRSKNSEIEKDTEINVTGENGKEISKMPPDNNLNSSDLAKYEISQIKSLVYNDSLSNALISCIRAVFKNTK